MPPSKSVQTNKSWSKGEKMTNIKTFAQLPENYDSRLTAILSEPIPDDVLMSFYYIAAAKSPHPNYRWDLHQDGRLFLVHHSGQNVSYEITFDQPLPLQPNTILSNDEIETLYSQLEQAKFFEQPGFQKTDAKDGNYVVVRVHMADKFHEVVYQNVEDPFVEYLYSIAY
jgi:hypothetical protein